MRRALATAAVFCLALTGCAGEDEPSTGASPEPETSSETAMESSSPEPTVEPSEEPSEDSGSEAIEVEIEGNEIEPSGERVKASVGEPVTLEITSDREAELHVHSSPEQEIAVPKGTSTHQITIDRPGVVDVEEHDSGIVVIQLEVR
jgi:hypothetical protein